MNQKPFAGIRKSGWIALLLAILTETPLVAQALNEVVFPVVVNGAVADKLHYQTIFTVLNASTQEIRATLQIYSNDGSPVGVFCSPLAPPPSSVSPVLSPNAQYFQFTSADLPFLNGWARLRWEGPPSVLASSEVTLVAAAPARCMLVCNRPSTEKLSSAQIPAVRQALEFRIPITLNGNRQSAVALINPSATETVNVRVTLLNSAGQNADLGIANSFEIRIRPLERISQYFWQMALEHSPPNTMAMVPEMFQGAVILKSDLPFAAGALNMMFPEGKFVAIPVISAVP